MRFDMVGCSFLGISAFLYSMRFVAAAVFMGPGLHSWSADHFQASYGYVGGGLTNWATVSLVAGVLVLLAGCLTQVNKLKKACGKTGGNEDS